MSTRLTTEERTRRNAETTAAAVLDSIADSVVPMVDDLLPLYDSPVFAALDQDERDHLGDLVNAMHDAVQAFRSAADLRRSFASQVGICPNTLALVQANID